MRVKIGKCKNFIGCYQIAEILCFWAKKDKDGEKPDYVHDFGTWLSETKTGEDSRLTKFCEWIYSKRKRNIKIHDYDIWNFDSTLAILILPGLKMIKEDKHGAPFVDDEDVPDELKSTNAPLKENEHDTDSLWFQRWDWVLDEMIWSFTNLQPDSDWESQFHSGVSDFKFEKCKDNSGMSEMVRGENDTHVFNSVGYKIYADRIQNGCRLMGKYFQNLWT